MPLSPQLLEQAIWIEGIVKGKGPKGEGGLAEREKWVENEKTKQDKLDQVRAQINRLKDQIRAGQEFTVRAKRDGVLGKLGVSKDVNAFDKSVFREKSNESQQFDTVHHGKKTTKGIDSDTYQQLMESQTLIVELQRQMEETGLFAPHEISEELWTPLVREELLPENAVPDKFSRMNEMWDESTKLYDKRIQEFTLSRGVNASVIEALDEADYWVDKGAETADVLLSLTGNDTKMATNIAAGVKLTMKAGISVAKAIAQKDLTKGFDNLPAAAGAIVKAATGNKDLAAAVTGGCKIGFKSSIAAYKMAMGAKNNDKNLILEAIGDIADGIGTGFEMADTVHNAGKEKKDQIDTWSKVGATVSQLIKAPKTAGKIVLAVKAGKPSEVYAAIKDTIGDAAGSVVDFKLEQKDDEDDDDFDSRKDELKSGVTGTMDLEEQVKGMSGEDREKPTKAMTATDLAKKYGLDEKDPKILKMIDIERKRLKEENEIAEKEKKEAERSKNQTGEEIAEELAENRQAFSKQLAAAFAMDVDPGAEMTAETIRQMNSIETLIAQMEMDRAIIKTAETIFGGGMTIASQFFPALKMGTAAVEFAKNIMAAVQRAIELNNFLDVLGSSKKAHNVYGEAWVNRVRSTRVQMSKNLVDALIKMAEIIGAAVTMSGYGAAAGQAIEKGAVAAKIAADVLYKVADQAKLALAWRKLMEAKANPGDRILMREALWGNPTLSKYAIAYGASELGDALAIAGLRHAGLSTENLASADPSLIVKFMELKFSEDSVLLKATREVKWKPKSVTLTLTSWAANRDNAIDKSKLHGAGTGSIDGAFATFDGTGKKYKAEKDKTEPTIKEYIKAIEGLKSALNGYTPMSIGEDHQPLGPHHDMEAYVNDLIDLCDKELESAAGELEGLKIVAAIKLSQQDKNKEDDNDPGKKEAQKVMRLQQQAAIQLSALAVKGDPGHADLLALCNAGIVHRFVLDCEKKATTTPLMKEPVGDFKTAVLDYKAKLTIYRKQFPLTNKGEESSKGAEKLVVLRTDLSLLLKDFGRALFAASA